MASLNPYLNFMGKTEEAFNFYKSVFGGDFVMLQRFKDVPGMDKLPKEEQNQIMHVSLPIGKGILLMGSDALKSMGHSITSGNNFHINISADSKEEATKLFNGLSAGGQVTMPIADAFWGAYFGMFVDKFGVQWMVNHEYKK